MYHEKQSFENLMARMLSRIPDGIDKREGSIIWDALAPAALEIESIYYALDGVIEETMAVTAGKEFLKLRALERGLEPFPATKAIIKAQFNVEVNKGIRFNYNGVVFVVDSVIDNDKHIYRLECEQTGLVGNVDSGTLVQIDYVKGLQNAQILGVIVNGKEEEETERFRQRYFDSFKERSFGGNIADYIEKTLAINGVGSCKVTPIWKGGGSVKVTILDSNYNKANTETINFVQNKLDPTQDGTGVGLAPIGHIVTVDTVEDENITLSVKATFNTLIRFENKKEEFKTQINQYFTELKKKWHKEQIILRPAHIISRLLNLNNVEDITELKINGKVGNYTLENNKIPKLVDIVEVQ